MKYTNKQRLTTGLDETNKWFCFLLVQPANILRLRFFSLSFSITLI